MNRTFAAALALSFALGGQARAHAFLASAIPPVGGTVPQSPAAVTIAFTEGVEPLFSTITVIDATGRHMETGQPQLVGDARHLAIALLPLVPGSYRVAWHAVSVDTHKTQGSYSFTVGP